MVRFELFLCATSVFCSNYVSCITTLSPCFFSEAHQALYRWNWGKDLSQILTCQPARLHLLPVCLQTEFQTKCCIFQLLSFAFDFVMLSSLLKQFLLEKTDHLEWGIDFDVLCIQRKLFKQWGNSSYNTS